MRAFEGDGIVDKYKTRLPLQGWSVSLKLIMRFIHRYQASVFKKEGSAWSFLFREVSRITVDAFERKAPVVWTTAYVFPMEMIWALGLIPVDFEILAGFLSAAYQTGPMLRASDRFGLPQDTCTVHRIAVGAALSDQLPRPDLIVTTTHYCDGKAKTNEIMAQRYGVEYLLVDMPLEDTEEARAYLKGQLLLVFERLSELAKIPCREEVLSEAVASFNDMTRYMRRANDLRKSTPCPFLPNNGGFILNFVGTLLYGSPLAPTLYELLDSQWRKELEERKFPQEKFRILWLMASPTFQATIFEWLEDRGARVVMEELSHCYWGEMDPSRPLDSMVDRMFSNTFMGKAERRARTAVELAKSYRVDCAIHFGHLPCRQANGALKLLRDALEEEGIKLIQLEGDLADPTGWDEVRVRNHLSAHLEMLQGEISGRRAWARGTHRGFENP